jgi:hypothetical protein
MSENAARLSDPTALVQAGGTVTLATEEVPVAALLHGRVRIQHTAAAAPPG